MKSKGNIVVLLAMAVLVLMFAAAGVLLFRGISRFNTAEKMADRLYRKLEAYYSRNPFPSEINVATVRDNAEKLNTWSDALLAELRRNDIEVEERSPSRFMAFLGKTRNKLLALAEAQGVGLHGDFGFGFDKYLADGSELPPPAMVPDLMRQLLSVESVTRILMMNRVDSIDVIQREDVGRGVSKPVPRTPPGGRSISRTVSRASAPAAAAPNLYRKMEFTFEFTAVERVVMAVLNDLMRERGFVTISALELRRDWPGVIEQVTGEATEVPTIGEDGRPSTTLVWPPQNDRVISGPGQEKPMRVKMKIEVYRFTGEVEQ